MRKVGKTIFVTPLTDEGDEVRRYRVEGQLFFASAEVFAAGFEHRSSA